MTEDISTPTDAAPYADWKAPAGDGQALLWPAGDVIIDQTRRNRDRLDAAGDVRVQGMALPELRRRARVFLGLGDEPIVATGHQSELYHPGVWAKNLVLHHAAEAIGGQAVHVVVDTDAPKHLNLRWPPAARGRVGADEPITDDPALASAAWTGQLTTPTPAHVDHLRSRLERAWFDHTPMLAGVLDALASANVEQTLALAPEGQSLPAALTAATHALDWELGLRHAALTLSPMLLGEPFLLLVHHVAANLDRFADDYNDALAGYRERTGLRDPQRPMPDLEPGELPLWLDNLATGGRDRARLVDGALEIDDDRFVFDPAADGEDAARRLALFLRGRRHRLAPRALVLTLFLRLAVADNFVHGIGGGRYDQVTDDVIRRHFAVAPPAFTVATATLFFPGSGTIDRICPPCVKQQVHDASHDFPGKAEHLRKIAAKTGRARLEAFRSMHADRQSQDDLKLEALLERLDAMPRQVAWERAYFDRELFYALQPRGRLRGLIERFGDVFTRRA